MQMKKTLSLRNLYLYLICFIMVIMIATGIVQTINQTIDLVMLDTSYFTRDISVLETEYNAFPEELKKTTTLEKYIETEREKEEQQISSEKKLYLKYIFKSLSLLFVATPFYIYHWRKIEKEA